MKQVLALNCIPKVPLIAAANVCLNFTGHRNVMADAVGYNCNNIGVKREIKTQ